MNKAMARLLVGLAGLVAAGVAVAEERSPQSPADFGDKINILQIPAAGFQPRCGALAWDYSQAGFIYATNNPCNFPSEIMWTPVTLPTGARIQFLDLYYNDLDPAENVTVILRAIPIAGAQQDLATVSSTGSDGAGYASSPLFSYIVNNDLQFDAEGRQLVVILAIPAANTSRQFKGVDLWWTRPVSPAPAVARFNDVPPNHPFFQFIEALAKSGVTGGCSTAPALYCPDSPVTRGQMAVFLSRALGLSWFDQTGLE